MSGPPLCADDWRRAARRVLPRFVFDFVDGGADDESALERNRLDLQAVTLTPRVLNDTRTLDTGITLFGRRWARPFGITPTGLNGLLRPGADAMLAAAAATAGVPFVAATPSNVRLEALRAQVPQGMLWLQLYVMSDRAIAEQLLRRARALAIDALVLTVDVPVGGRRERERRHGFTVPLRWTPRLLWDIARHPRWAMSMARGGAPRFPNLVEHEDAAVSPQAQAALMARAMDRSLAWADLAWLRSHWSGPLVLKGVLHPDDARRAVARGIDAVWVSNHGGRQSALWPSAISAVPAVAEAVDGRVPVLFDGGLRRGGEVLKALSLGAQAAFFGRPLLWSVAVAGQAGAEACLAQLGEQLESSMALLGVADVGSFAQRALHASAALAAAAQRREEAAS